MTEPEQSRIADLEAENADLKRREAVLVERLAKAYDDLAQHQRGASRSRLLFRPKARPIPMATGG